MGKRKRAREDALKILYEMDMADMPAEDAIEAFIEVHGRFSGEEEFIKSLVFGVEKKKQEIDELIRRFSEHWRLDRMSPVDRSALRIGVFELLYRDDIPPRVSINEAIELGKKFGDTESGAFINGILDAIYSHLLKEGLIVDKDMVKQDKEVTLTPG